MNYKTEKIIAGLTILYLLTAVPNLLAQLTSPSYPKAGVLIYSLAGLAATASGVFLIWKKKNFLRYIFLLGCMIAGVGFISSGVVISYPAMFTFPFFFGSMEAGGVREGIIINLPLLIPFIAIGIRASQARWES